MEGAYEAAVYAHPQTRETVMGKVKSAEALKAARTAKAKKAALQKAINDLAAFSGVDPATCFEMAAQRAAQNDTSLTPEFVSGLLESAKTKKERAQ